MIRTALALALALLCAPTFAAPSFAAPTFAAPLAPVPPSKFVLAQAAPKPDPAAIANPDMPSATLCPVIVAPVRFCGTAPAFALTPQTSNGDVDAFFETPEGVVALMIVEPLPAGRVTTVPDLQQTALQIVAAASGQPVAAIPVLARGSVIVSGVPRPNMVYSGIIDGVSYVYSNSTVLLDDLVIQLITFETGVTTYSPRHRDLHTRFLANVQVMP